MNGTHPSHKLRATVVSRMKLWDFRVLQEGVFVQLQALFRRSATCKLVIVNHVCGSVAMYCAGCAKHKAHELEGPPGWRLPNIFYFFRTSRLKNTDDTCRFFDIFFPRSIESTRTTAFHDFSCEKFHDDCLKALWCFHICFLEHDGQQNVGWWPRPCRKSSRFITQHDSYATVNIQVSE